MLKELIKRPVAATLIAVGICFAGIIALQNLPVAPLPQIEFPTIMVRSALPGASPEIMATAVVTPLEHALGSIAGVVEMTSASNLGSARIIVQFDLNRTIDGAARDVQAAINAARADLPADLPQQPTYRKVNPADPPILIMAVTSTTNTVGELFDLASTSLQQDILQSPGVGDVQVGGGALPAVRIELDPFALQKVQLTPEDVRNAVRAATVLSPKGQLRLHHHTLDITANDQLMTPEEYGKIVLAYRGGRPVYLADVAKIVGSVEDLTVTGAVNGQPAVMLVIFKEPGANIIHTVDRIKQAMPRLKSYLPASVELKIVQDRTSSIRGALADVQRTLLIALALVVGVIFVFLQNFRASLIAALVIPLAIMGTFAIMFLGGYSLDILSLMALTIAIGFVVDDAVVVIENICSHLEHTMTPLRAALRGAREVVSTLVSMSVSLIAVFLPILLMGGIVGRLFREFAIVLSIAILLSMLISVILTPVFAAQTLQKVHSQSGRLASFYCKIEQFYSRTLKIALNHQTIVGWIMVGTCLVTVVLLAVVPKGFFPEQDTGRMTGTLVADQNTSYISLREKLFERMQKIGEDPAVACVVGITGFMNLPTNSANFFVTLKPLSDRHDAAVDVMARLRQKLEKMPGADVYMQVAQDFTIGGRKTNALYQYSLVSADLAAINFWAPKILERMTKIAILRDVNSDQMSRGLRMLYTYDRERAGQLGLTAAALDQFLYDGFGQRQVANLYSEINQYHVVMEYAPAYWDNPAILERLFLKNQGSSFIPFDNISAVNQQSALLVVNHQGLSPAATLSFNLAKGAALGDAVKAIEATTRDAGLPSHIYGVFSGMAQVFRESLASQPYLVLAALFTVYCVLGVLYESWIHPLTILSTLPSAGLGGLLALFVTGLELNLIGLIGLFLLIGIVKKNAIMMIDVALALERQNRLTPNEAIFEACQRRLRPILMTTAAALMSAIPMAFSLGEGTELQRPLGISIIGGLLVSQVLTLYTTPVLYLKFAHMSWRRLITLRFLGFGAR